MKRAAASRTLTDFKMIPVGLPNEGFKNLYLHGPSGYGKTQLALALLPGATVVRHRDSLKECDFSQGVIFDDFDVTRWSPASVIHLLDWEVQSAIDVKHSTVIIPPETRKIITFNEPVEGWYPHSATPNQREAIRRRLDCWEIGNKLY